MPRIAAILLLFVAGLALAQTAPGPNPPGPGLTTFRPAGPLEESVPGCAFSDLKFPGDFAVFAAGSYSGRKLNFQIDQSGHQATQFDVTVNYKAKPVVLMLGAYEPTIWNIGWTSNTRIIAVLISGYHRQVIAGLDPKVPTLNSSFDNRGGCGYFYSVERNEDLNALSRRLFGRPVDLSYPAMRSSFVIGERVLNPGEVMTSTSVTPESFRDKSAPLAAEAGLEDARRRGLLRRATQADAQAWVDAKASAVMNANRDVPPVAGGTPKPHRASVPHNGYVVLKDFEMPAGLYGGHAATFFVPKGVPRPRGNPGQSIIYDFNTIDCKGSRCVAQE